MVLPRVPHSLPRHGTLFWNLGAVELAFPEAVTNSTKEWMLVSITSGLLCTHRQTLTLDKKQAPNIDENILKHVLEAKRSETQQK